MVTTKKDRTVRYALKCIKKRFVVKNNQQEAIANERSVMAEVDHPFIIKFVRSFKSRLFIYLLQELCTGGELLDALDGLGLLNKTNCQFYIGSLLLALEYLHSRRIAYLDLKSENCLIDHTGYIKLIDFGIAQRITGSRAHAVLGTPIFMAPEMILGKGYTTSADLWALGVCVYEFMIGDFPFGNTDMDHEAIFKEVLKAPLKFPEWFDNIEGSEEAKSLCQGLLERDPLKRPGAGFEGYYALKTHAFFSEFSWDDLLGRKIAPPMIPEEERYAEDLEEGAADRISKEPLGVEEDERISGDSKDKWVDPKPGWDKDF